MAKKRKAFKRPPPPKAKTQDEAMPAADDSTGEGGPPMSGPATQGAPMTDEMRMKSRYGG